ncbi:hypothetical protein JCGZ_11910 [Jatropha curcas]|uniref:Uncharacterized protein n=1 Tax=Jatropha curcas TaxID=180498 RepID=A0A067KRH7_JATCU|nr:hypothetical protein JCGZ_11910 [Jatropha curcas]
MSATEERCKYYWWRHAFPVTLENRVNARKEVEEWVVMLVFPCGERLRRGTSFICVFAFLPSAMVTNFPFGIQADFMLASSRETIILDKKWNLGMQASSALFSLPQAFKFLPLKTSLIPEFNSIRESIKATLQSIKCVPCSSLHDFRIPSGVIMILPEFGIF